MVQPGVLQRLPRGEKSKMNDQPKREDFKSEEAYDDAVDEYLAQQSAQTQKFTETFAEIFGGAE